MSAKEQYISDHFPKVECGGSPTGNQILVQLRTIKEKSAGGIVFVQDTKKYNDGNTRIALLIKTGQIAFRDRTSGETWKEGAWANVGDVVIIPAHGGFRFEVPVPGTNDKAIFALFNDYDVKMTIEDNFGAFDAIL
jgi:co-chaperonin GroES (HSP10)